MKKILIINGPNLNLLGFREPDIYGNKTFAEYYSELAEKYPEVGLNYYQSNHEGDIIDKLHSSGFFVDGIVLNAGAYTHTSIAIADAIKSITAPVVEVHISDVYQREKFRHHSYLAPVCCKTIVGKGLPGYYEAIEYLLHTERRED